MKINDRVRVIDECSPYYGLVGKIVDLDYTVLFNDGKRNFFAASDLEPVSPSFETLLVGDVIEVDGEKAKVLEVGVNSFLRSRIGEFNITNHWYTFEQAKQYGWKVVGQEEDSLVEKVAEKVEEWVCTTKTMKEVAEDIIKLVKEG